MSYNIILPDGTNLGSIADGTADNTHTSLTLVGRNYTGYGQIMTNNLTRLLVNSAYNVSPTHPNTGQIWYDTGNNLCKVYTGSTWKNIGAATYAISAPTTTVGGDLWWDSNAKQLYCYDGTTPYSVNGWILVGPGYNVNNGKSGALWEQIDSNDVVSVYLDGTRTAIISSSTFTPSTPITGFSTIVPGWNMSTSYTIYGTANNASYLGTQPAANYFRNNLNNVGSGSLTLTSNAGVTLGSVSNFTANVHGTTGTGQLWNTSQGANISLHVATPSGSVKALAAYGADGLIYLAGDPTSALGATTKQYVDNKFNDTVLYGSPTAPTAPAGTANTMVATTAFVINNSGLYPYKIYKGSNTWMWMDTSSANLQVSGATVMTATSSGVALTSGATAVTVGQTNSDAGNAAVATTQYVRTAQTWWGNATHKSAKWVSTDAPSLGVNDIGSNDGDFWFQFTN